MNALPPPRDVVSTTPPVKVPENPLRLQQRAPDFLPTQGDFALYGFEQAMRMATERARDTGKRHVVTCGRYSPGAFRVQAWR